MDISREDFDNIRMLIKERSGINLGPTKIDFLASKITHRLKVTNCDTIKEYYFYLKYDSKGPSEIDSLVELVAINETFFFRHQDQLDDFIQIVLPEVLKSHRPSKALSIWSAGCSSGEEAYTLAIMLRERNGDVNPDTVSILASDISSSALLSAREAIYDDYSVRNVPKNLLQKYFSRDDRGRYNLDQSVKSMVRIASINLMDSKSTGRVRNMDCIFCRNVMIYFDDKDKQRCVERLYEALNDDGYVFLGHSESLGRISNLLEPVRLKNTVAYRKPRTGGARRS